MECIALLFVLAVALPSILGFFHLRHRNEELSARLANLERRIAQLSRQPPESAAAEALPAAPREAPATVPPHREEPLPEAPLSGIPPLPAAPAAASARSDDALPRTVTAPPEAAPPPSPPPPAAGPRFDIDWEQWLGMRGAAVAGGILLALAALFFLRYAVEEGFFPPVVRVSLGFLTGTGAILASEILRRRGYATTADALAGAGVVILYAATWAGAVLYTLLPYALAFGLMILVTVVCGLLAWRRASRLIALLGLVGGFATPLLLSSGRDDPLGLFGYVLLLDGGLLWLARRRRWPILVPLALAGTFFYQALWIFFRMDADRLWIGLGVVAVFAVLFALSGGRPDSGEEAADRLGLQRLTSFGGVSLPFVFALYFAFQVRADLDLLPLATLLVLLSVAAEAVGRRQGMPLLGTGAAAAALGVVFAWWARVGFPAVPAGKLVLASVALAAAFHVFTEIDRRRGRPVATWSAPLAAGGFLLLLVLGPALVRGTQLVGSEPAGVPALLPWLAGWALLAALLVRQSRAPKREAFQLVAAMGLAAGFGVFHAAFKGVVPAAGDGLPPAPVFFGLALLGGVVFHALVLADPNRPAAGRRLADMAAGAYPLVLLMILFGEATDPVASYLSPTLFLATTLALAVLAALAAFRLPEGPLYFGIMALTALEHGVWSLWVPGAADPPAVAVVGLTGFGLAVLLFTAGPFAAGRRFAGEPWAWWAAALAGPAWFLSLRSLWELRFGDGAIGLLPLALGALALTAAFAARAWLPAADPARRRALVWFAGAALSFVAVAIPLQLEKEWITLGWALQAVAVLALWRRLDHPGLKILGLALAAAVTVRLLINPEVLHYYPRSPRPVFNWLMYTYLVPAAALLASARLLVALEVGRRRPFEDDVYRLGRPVGAIGCTVAAILVTFWWINLTIFDAFSTGAVIDLTLDRLPARDLTLSLAWILYALLLLTIGFVRHVTGLRWTGLAFLCLTLAKLFLYDLGELAGLYRVGSFVGLAVSLLAVSLAYQRFLSGRPEEAVGAAVEEEE